MATVLQPIVNELNTVLVQLRTELRGLQTDADGAGIAIDSALPALGCSVILRAGGEAELNGPRECLD